MLARALRRIWYLLNRRRMERELEREMAAHRAEMDDPRRFGAPLRLREQSADVWGLRWLDDLWRDLRHAARQLRRTPGFTLAAVFTLAVGIGANTTAFGLVKTVFFAELPVPSPEALRQFEWAGHRDFSEAAFRYVHDHVSGFAALTCVTGQADATLGRGDREEPVRASRVSGEFFRTFGPAMAAGRPLTPADDRAEAPPVSAISYELWQRSFGSEPSAIGSVITIDDVPVTIVGVMRRGFTTSVGRRLPDVLLPTTPSRAPEASDRSARERSCRIIGRLSADRPEELTQQESERLLRGSGLTLPIDREPQLLRSRLRLVLRRVGRGIDEVPVDRGLVRGLANDLPQIAGTMFLLLSVLIVPCANVAAMLLARAITRRQEIAARLALGASRARLVRQLLTEGAMLSALAGVVGVLLSWVLWSMAFSDAAPFALDLTALAATAAICAVATLSFALVPALTATRGDLASQIRESSAGTPGRARSAPGASLVALQVVISCILLAVALLQARSLLRLTQPAAVEPERLLLVDVNPGRDAAGSYVDESLSRLTRVPGVVSVAAASSDGLYISLCEDAEGRAGREIPVWLWGISPGYFATTRLPLLRGREFTGLDSGAAGSVAIINGVLAQSLFGRVNPVGRRLPLAACRPGEPTVTSGSLTIVGVAVDDRGSAAIYLPYAQLAPDGTMRAITLSRITFAARVAGNAVSLAGPVRRAMRESAPGVTVGAMETEAERKGRGSRAVRMLTAVYLLLGLLATAQAAFGLYGTVSHFVNRRTAEIGVRIVLGARTSDVVRLVVRQALTPVVIGLLLGLACSPIVARVMWAARLTSEAGWTELLAIAALITLVMLSAFAVAARPVRRVSRLDPAAALRYE